MPLATTHVLEGGYNRDQLALVTEIRDHLARIAPYDTPSAQSEDAPPRNERAGDAPFDTGGRRSLGGGHVCIRPASSYGSRRNPGKTAYTNIATAAIATT